MKGALRYKRLDDNVRGLGSAEHQVRWWFIATTGGSSRGGSPSRDLLFNANATAIRLVFASESIVAVTDTEVMVAPVGGPGVFGSSLDTKNLTRGPIGSVKATFDPASELIEIDGTVLHIFVFHEYDALQVMHRMGAEMPGWFTPT